MAKIVEMFEMVENVWNICISWNDRNFEVVEMAEMVKMD